DIPRLAAPHRSHDGIPQRAVIPGHMLKDVGGFLGIDPVGDDDIQPDVVPVASSGSPFPDVEEIQGLFKVQGIHTRRSVARQDDGLEPSCRLESQPGGSRRSSS
ncbi:MAG: hypothetical protein HGB17_12525, partial [Syntrophobacteraceae bacterium]|nr:hypothetical protein [Syntrophobacteraceae bacterium]